MKLNIVSRAMIAILASMPLFTGGALSQTTEVCTALDPASGREGTLYVPPHGGRFEVGCAIGDFGALTGRPYLMVSGPTDLIRRDAETLRVINPVSSGYWARFSLQYDRLSGRSSPPIPIVVAQFLDGADDGGNLYAFAIDLSAPEARRYLSTRLAEGTTFHEVYLGIFPPSGDAVFSVRIEGSDASQPCIREAFDRVTNQCH